MGTQIYRGETVDIDRARDVWRPRLLWDADGNWCEDADLRVRVPKAITIDDFDELIRIADDNGASDVTIQVGEPVLVKVAGAWHKMTSRPLTTSEVDEFLRETYDPTGPGEVAQRGRPVDYAYVIKPADATGRKIRLRSNATGGRDPQSDSAQVNNGVQISLRVLPGTPATLQERNVDQVIIDNITLDRGLIFITGPTGSGKTTLLGGAIRHIAETPKNSAKIVEYSAPIELVYDDIDFPRSHLHQLEAGRALRLRPEEGGAAMVWAACVANAMRRIPDLIVIGEARDAPTIEGCITAAMTGHKLMSTMHTIGAAETLRRAIMSLPPEQRAAVAIDMMEVASMFVSQLLVPRVGGGLTAVREYVVFDAASRRRIVNAPLDQWTGLLQSMMTDGEIESQRMIDHARRLFEAGEIDERQFEIVAARQRVRDRRLAPISEDGPQLREAVGGGLGFSPDLDIESGVAGDLIERRD